MCEPITDSIDTQKYPNEVFAEYSMPAFDASMKPDIVLGSSMNSVRKIITRPCLLVNKLNVRKKRIWYVKKPNKNAVCSAEFIPLHSDTVDLTFLNQVAKSETFTRYLENHSSGSSNSQKRITPRSLMLSKLYIPTIEEQKLIGKIFESLDHTITLHEEKKHQLERLKSALLQKMFADKSGYPVVRFKKYNSTWVLRRIIDLLNQAITDGPHETPCLVSKGIPFISADAIVNNKIDFSRKRGNITEEYDLECCKKYQPQMHDIYLVKSGSTVGKVAIVETTTRFNIWSPLAALRCGEKSDPYFVFFLMQTEKFQTQVKNKASNGTQPNLSMRALEGFKVIVSTELNEQQAIGNLFKKMNELIDLHQHKIDNLIAVKQWLLQNMFI